MALVFVDEKAPAAERFKAVGARETRCRTVRGGSMALSRRTESMEGVDEPLLKKNSDTGKICIPDGDVYRLYVRMWSGGDSGCRIVGYTESPTFGGLSPIRLRSSSPDKDDPVDLHFYNSATSKLNENLYLMFPSGFFTKSDTCRCMRHSAGTAKSFPASDARPCWV